MRAIQRNQLSESLHLLAIYGSFNTRDWIVKFSSEIKQICVWLLILSLAFSVTI